MLVLFLILVAIVLALPRVFTKLLCLNLLPFFEV